LFTKTQLVAQLAAAKKIDAHSFSPIFGNLTKKLHSLMQTHIVIALFHHFNQI
jgi:hypothetical protein